MGQKKKPKKLSSAKKISIDDYDPKKDQIHNKEFRDLSPDSPKEAEWALHSHMSSWHPYLDFGSWELWQWEASHSIWPGEVQTSQGACQEDHCDDQYGHRPEEACS